MLKHILINQNRNHCNQQSYLVTQTVKSACNVQVQALCWEDPLEKGMATHSSILAWEIPWMEESGGPQSMGSQRVGHDWATNTLTQSTHFLPMRNKFVYSGSVKSMLQDWANSWKAFSASCWLWKCFLHKKLLRCW